MEKSAEKTEVYTVKSNTWTRIATVRREKRPEAPAQTPPPPRKPAGPSAAAQMMYIIYGKKPYCVMKKTIYAMHIIDNPSLGYKLVDSGIEYGLAMMSARFITEGQALSLVLAMSK